MADDWAQIQSDLRAGVYGDWHEIRHQLATAHGERHPGDGISSSDMNHMAYAAAKYGELERVDSA